MDSNGRGQGAPDVHRALVQDGLRPVTGRPLRIGMVVPPLLPVPPERYAGTERVVAALADGLAARGHHVTLFASGDSTAGTETVPVLPSAAWTERFEDDIAPYLLKSAAAAWSQAGRFDVLHAHLEVIGLPLARHAPVPVLTTFHGRLDTPGAFDLLRDFPDVPLVAISASQRRWHPGLNWVATIPHGLDLAAMPWRPVPGGYLAVVGRASPEKGIAEAIEVAARTGHPLRIAAKAHDPAEQAMVRDLIRPAADQGVEFLGEVGADVRDPLLSGARATLMLGAWPEPFGLVAIESLATGTPVIARRAGALPEIIEHGVDGFLVDDLDEACLAVRLVEELDRTAIRRRALERFETARMVDAYENAYRGIIAERGRNHAGTIPVPSDGGLSIVQPARRMPADAAAVHGP